MTQEERIERVESLKKALKKCNTKGEEYFNNLLSVIANESAGIPAQTTEKLLEEINMLEAKLACHQEKSFFWNIFWKGSDSFLLTHVALIRLHTELIKRGM